MTTKVDVKELVRKAGDVKKIFVITEDQLVKILKNIRHATFATITAVTIPKMNKTGNPYYDGVTKAFTVRKVAEVNLITGYDYELKVKNALLAAGQNPDEFIVGERAWGEVIGWGLVSHHDKLYFRTLPRFVLSSKFVDLQGNDLPWEDVNAWCVKRSVSQKQVDAGLDEVETVNPCDYTVSNIVSIRINGKRYTIKR